MGNTTVAAKWRKEKATRFASATAERAIRDLHSGRFNHHQIVHCEHRKVFVSSICEDTRRAQADDNEGRG